MEIGGVVRRSLEIWRCARLTYLPAEKVENGLRANCTNICWKLLEMRARKAHFEAKRGEILAQSRFSLEKFHVRAN